MELTQNVYTVQEVADMLKLAKRTIYENIRKGNIKVSKFGGEYRFTKDQLQYLLENGYKNK